jgi:hypothetical protein
MVLHDARRDPLGDALSLQQIAVERPHSGAIRLRAPPGVAWRGEERMLDGKDEMPARREEFPKNAAYRLKVRHIVQRQ